MIAFAILGATLAITNPFDLEMVYAQSENNIEVGMNFDRELLYTNATGAFYKWNSATDRILDLNGNYVNYILQEDSEKIYFESAHNTIIFDKAGNVIETYPKGLLSGQAEQQINHVIKEAVNGTDIWYDILVNDESTTTHTEYEYGMQIISKKGEFETIYDISTKHFEITYKYKNTDPSKTNHKYGFTTVCDGIKCNDVVIDGLALAVGDEKNKNQIIGDKKIEVGNKRVDLKNEQHNATWALKHVAQDKVVIDYTDAKGALAVGDTLIVV